MAIILGLDVSTSCTGVCILESTFDHNVWITKIKLLEAIEFKKCKTLWEKADVVAEYLDDVIRGSFEDGRLETGLCPDRVVLEEPLMGFRPGMSSAQTITQLMRFNGIVSYLARRTFHQDPEYIGSAHARKLCGMKLQRTAIAGPQKEQVFTHMAANDLSKIQWPLTKTGKVVPWSRDATDAYVIARAAVIEGPIQPMKKPKKSKKADAE